MTSPERFLARMRASKLIQWALAYLAGAWLILQVLDFLRENFGWSPTAVRIGTVVLAFGFLCTLVLAWYHGEKGRQRVSRMELTILVGLFLLGGLVVSRVPRGDTQSRLSLARPASPSVTVAVLPFDNLSVSEEDALLAEGLTLETHARVGSRSQYAWRVGGRFLRVDPFFEALRGNDRFEALLARMDEHLRRMRENIEREGITDGIDAMVRAGR